MKIRKGVLGLALSLACLNSAHAAVSAGGTELSGGAQQPEGELFLSVFDEINQVTYTRDLGIDVVSTDFDSATFSFSADPLYGQTFGGVDPSTLRYSIVGGQNDLETLFVLGIWFTSSSSSVATLDTFSGLSSAHGTMFDFTIGTNEATMSPMDYASDVSVAVSNPASAGFYDNAFTSPRDFGSIASYDTSAAPGTGMPFYKTEISNATGGQVVSTTFAGTWTLGTDGSLTYSADADTDGDGTPDSADNCITVPNAGQQDTNGDGYGNACDADLNNDCIINVVDLGRLRAVFFTNDPDADFDSSGIVNVVDLGILRSQFFGAPGPSALTNVCD